LNAHLVPSELGDVIDIFTTKANHRRASSRLARRIALCLPSIGVKTSFTCPIRASLEAPA
jgi:hypothetical protein